MSFPDAPSYGASSQSRATNNNKFPAEGPRVMQTRVEFTAANQTAVIDLTIEQQQKQISQVQGLWINNNTVANLELVAEVTNQVINIPAGGQGFIQLLSQNPPRFRVTSDAIAKVDFHFLNFPVIHAMNFPAGGGGGGIVQSIVPGINITVDNTDPANPIVSATGGGGGGGGNYTFNATNPATLSVDDLIATPNQYVLQSLTAMDLPGGAEDYSQAGACVTIRAQGGALAITARAGAGQFLDGAGGVVTLNVLPAETVVLMYVAQGIWIVVDRYLTSVRPSTAAMIDPDSLPTPFTIQDDSFNTTNRNKIVSNFLPLTPGDTMSMGSLNSSVNYGSEVTVKNLTAGVIKVAALDISVNIYDTTDTPVSPINIPAGECLTLVGGAFGTWYTVRG